MNDATPFVKYDHSFNPKNHLIALADGYKISEIVTARGTAVYKIMDSGGTSHTLELKNALLAPSFPVSLLSVSAATQQGAHVSFANKKN